MLQQYCEILRIGNSENRLLLQIRPAFVPLYKPACFEKLFQARRFGSIEFLAKTVFHDGRYFLHEQNHGLCSKLI